VLAASVLAGICGAGALFLLRFLLACLQDLKVERICQVFRVTELQVPLQTLDQQLQERDKQSFSVADRQQLRRWRIMA
jgi:hypothetical protein